ncbi:MAG: PPC domain-containing protein, partial [Planktothrix sp.]
SSDKEIKDVLTGNIQNSSQRLARSGEVDNAGNEFATARDLGTLGKKQTFSDFVGDSDTIDYYRFEVTEKSSVVNLQLQGLSSNADLALYNSNGEGIDSSYNQGTTPELINTPLEVGTYYIQVSPDYWSSSNTQYNLTVSSKPDVGNTIKDAYNLGVLKGKKSLTDFVVGEWHDKSDPADYYRFQVKKWSNVKLAVTGLENEANVELLSGSGALIKSLDSVGDSTQTITETLKPGSYYIKADTNWTQAKYNLKLSSSAASENPANISNLSFSGKEGDKGTFEIQLKQKPKSDITLKFINGKYLTVDADNDVFTGTQDTITFTPVNWNQP